MKKKVDTDVHVKISKKIHYFWFGGNPLPELEKNCVASWKKFFPEYEIIRWDESNYQVDSCTYAKEAYQAKKWAFVTDYARFDVLYKYGGIYFDTDVEVIRGFEDLIAKGSFMGREVPDGKVAPGLVVAAEQGNRICEQIVNEYKKRRFVKSDGSYDQDTVVSFVSALLKEEGLTEREGITEIQKLGGLWIYPSDYFCPIDYRTNMSRITEHTRTIHHYAGSWLNTPRRIMFRIRHRFYGKGRAAELIMKILILPFRFWNKIETIGIKKTINLAFRKTKQL